MKECILRSPRTHSTRHRTIVVVEILVVALSIFIANVTLEGYSWHPSISNQAQPFQVLFDPCLGLTWEVVIDPQHPEWPAHMILLLPSVTDGTHDTNAHIAHEETALAKAKVIIHAGDRVSIRQDTFSVHARFDGRALGSASIGQSILVRITSGTDLGRNDGGMISVYVVGEGIAIWDPSRLPDVLWGVKP